MGVPGAPAGSEVAQRVAARPQRRRGRRWRWLAAIVVACLVVIWVAAITSTHAALSGVFVGWSGAVPGHTTGLSQPTAAEQAEIGLNPGDEQVNYLQVFWATRPGGEISFGFQLHNGGLAPVTVLGFGLRNFPPGVINALAPAGAQLGPGFGQMTPFHPVTLGPGGSAYVGLTERVVCDPLVRKDAQLESNDKNGVSWLGDDTSTVVIRYRALGVTMSQTVSVANPLLVILPYQSCK